MYWGMEVQLQSFLKAALDGGEWSASRPCGFTPGVRALGTHWIGGWVSPRAGLDAVLKNFHYYHCRKLNPGRPAPSLVSLLTELHRF